MHQISDISAYINKNRHMGQWEVFFLNDMCFFCRFFTKIPHFDVLWHQQPKNENF